MLFVYEYRTSDNVRHAGKVRAANRDAAYAALKAQGIRPGSVVDAPGFFNLLFGRGKRWLAIAVLSVVSALLLVTLMRTVPATRPDPREAMPSPRHYVELPPGYSLEEAFPDDGERLLARYALPGVAAEEDSADPSSLEACLGRKILIDPDDSEETIELKRIVAGMKDDLRACLASGFGDSAAYLLRLEERQAMESGYRNAVILRLRAGLVSRDEADAILSAMGLQPAE